jgi:hypothetical protein
MGSTAINTVMRMIESLPEERQDLVVHHLRDYILDLQDEAEWDEAFAKTRRHLVAAARRAKREIADGLSKPLKPTDL